MDAAEAAEPPAPGLRRAGTAAGVVAFAVCMALPVLVVGRYAPGTEAGATKVAGGVMAALGVLFRSTARNLLRSGVGTVVRAASRTASRRFIRRFLSTFVAFVVRGNTAHRAGRVGWWAPVAGAVGLAASLAGVLWPLSASTRAAITEGTHPVLFVLMGVVPLLAYFGWMRVGAARLGLQAELSTGVDGLLLQAYFTAAGSFLPLTSEVQLAGPERTKATLATISLSLFVVGHLVCTEVGRAAGLPALAQLGTFFLIYGFVFAFPLQPLDGNHVWRTSRPRWFALWAVITALFATRLPEAVFDVL